MRFTAVIKDGKIIWHDEKGLNEHLNLIDTEECYIDIKPSKVRNTAQNNYYWAVLRELATNVVITQKKCTMYAKATSR